MSDTAAATIRGLTIRQPWAWLIAHGHKQFENRTWWTDYRGPMAIVAGKGTDREGYEVARQLGIQVPETLPIGILAVVDLVDIRPVNEERQDPFATGPYCWRLERPRLLPSPVPFRGGLGLMKIPAELVQDGLTEEDVVSRPSTRQPSLPFD